MKKHILSALFLGVGLACASALPVGAQLNIQPGAQQQPATTKVPELTNEQMSQWSNKLNAYVNLFNRSGRAVDSWNRYKSWVNVKTGPTGKERNVYGLYSTYDDVVKELAPKAIAAAGEQPNMGVLDSATVAYAEALKKLDPILNDTVKYYDRKDYSDDKFAKGKELHPKLVEAFEAVVSTRNTFDSELTSVKNQLDQQQLATLEKTEGRKFNWHFKRVFMATRSVIDAATAVKSKSDFTAFSEAVKVYAGIVHEFDDYTASATDIPSRGSSTKGYPDNVLSALRGARDALEKNNLSSFSSATNNAIQTYNQMITFSRF